MSTFGLLSPKGSHKSVVFSFREKGVRSWAPTIRNVTTMRDEAFRIKRLGDEAILRQAVEADIANHETRLKGRLLAKLQSESAM